MLSCSRKSCLLKSQDADGCRLLEKKDTHRRRVLPYAQEHMPTLQGYLAHKKKRPP